MSFRVCIIGCGEQSRVAHGPSLRRYAASHPEVELASCCDPDPARAESFSRDFGFRKSYTEMEAMFTEESPDAAVMAVPTTRSAGVAERILRRGMPLMMEKPPGMNEAEVRLLTRIADEGGVPHLVAFNRRFMPLMVETEKLLRATESARGIQLISYEMFRVDRRDPDFSTTAVHAIDAVRFLAGSPYEEARFSYQDLPALGPTVANILIDGTMASGARVRIAICPAAGVVIERATAHFHGHSIFLHLPVWNALDAPGRLLHLEAGKVSRDQTGDALTPGAEMYETNGFFGQMCVFLDDVRAGRMPAANLASSLQAVQIMEVLRARKERFTASAR